MSGTGDPGTGDSGAGDSGFWDPASQPPRREGADPFDSAPGRFDPEPGGPYQPPGPSYQPPAYGSGSGSGDQPRTVWSPVESGPRPVFPPARQGTGPDWQQTADLSRPTPVEPVPVMAPIPPGPPTQPSRRGRRRGITIGVIVLAVLVLLVAVDRVTAYVVDRRVATEITNTYGLTQAPTVHFGGFPFLTQLATSHFRHITVSANNIPIQQESGEFTVAELDATLDGVRLSDSEVRIDSLQGSALVGYSAVSDLMGQQVSYAGQDAEGGRIKIAFTGILAVTAGLRFDTASKKLQVRDVRLAAGGQSVSIDILGPLINQLMRPVSELPDGVEVNRIDVTADGIRVHGTGSNLELPR